MQWIKNNVFGVALGVVLGIIIFSLFTSRCSRGRVDYMDTVQVVTIRYDTIPADTVWYPVYNVPDSNKIISVRDSIIFDTLKVLDDLKIRNYRRYFTDEWMRIEAQIEVYGHLLGADVEYVNLKPEIRKTITIESTVHIPQRGLYVGAWAGNKSIDLSLQYLNRKGWLYGYRYDVANQGHSIGVSKRIF